MFSDLLNHYEHFYGDDHDVKALNKINRTEMTTKRPLNKSHVQNLSTSHQCGSLCCWHLTASGSLLMSWTKACAKVHDFHIAMIFDHFFRFDRKGFCSGINASIDVNLAFCWKVRRRLNTRNGKEREKNILKSVGWSGSISCCLKSVCWAEKVIGAAAQLSFLI